MFVAKPPATHQPSASSTETHLGHIDALRGIAILGVILVHVTLLTQQRSPFLDIGLTGQRGVQLFYLVSAFTICLSLNSKRREHHPLFNYFLRRFFRIAPLFYVAVLANCLLSHVAPDYGTFSTLRPYQILLGLTFLNGLSPHSINVVALGGWSIAVETSFYVVLPFLNRHFNTTRRALVLFAITAVPLGWLSHIFAARAPDYIREQYFAFLWFPVELPVFVLGILAYRIWQQNIRGSNIALQKRKDISLVLILASFMLYCANLPFTDAKLYFSSFLFLTLILALSLHAWPLLVNGFTRFIGKISYSLYLLHFFVLQLALYLSKLSDDRPQRLFSRHIAGHWSGMLTVYLFVLGLSIPLCLLTWKFIEQPGIRLGSRLIALREGRHAPFADAMLPSLRELEATTSTRDSQF